MAINNFADVQNFFSAIDASQAPHGNFWKQNSDPNVSYQAFVNGDVPGGSQTANPDTGKPLPILIKAMASIRISFTRCAGRQAHSGTRTIRTAPSARCRTAVHISPMIRSTSCPPGSQTAAPNNGAAPSGSRKRPK